MAQRTDYHIALLFWLKGYYECWEGYVDAGTELDEPGMKRLFDETHGHLFNPDGSTKA